MLLHKSSLLFFTVSVSVQRGFFSACNGKYPLVPVISWNQGEASDSSGFYHNPEICSQPQDWSLSADQSKQQQANNMTGKRLDPFKPRGNFCTLGGLVDVMVQRSTKRGGGGGWTPVVSTRMKGAVIGVGCTWR